MSFSDFFKNFGHGLLGAFGSIVNGVGNAISTNNTNKTNLKIAQSVNESNERINQSQLAYNWDMWHAQNDYNNPSAQRQRLVDAGLNPIYYGLDGNSAASGNSFTPIANQQASPVIPNDFSAFGDAALKFAQIQNIKADTKLKDSESGFTREQAQTISQLRSGQIVIQGQQIKLNDDLHSLNGAKLKETLASVDSLRQSIFESDVRISDLRSQISKRHFDSQIQKASLALEDKYKNGLLSYQEKQLAVSWFNAVTSRQNASVNYYNAQTSRGAMLNNAFDLNQTREHRIRSMESMSHFNQTHSDFLGDENKRKNSSFTLEQIQRAANAYQSVVEAFFSPSKNALGILSNL